MQYHPQLNMFWLQYKIYISIDLFTSFNFITLCNSPFSRMKIRLYESPGELYFNLAPQHVCLHNFIFAVVANNEVTNCRKWNSICRNGKQFIVGLSSLQAIHSISMVCNHNQSNLRQSCIASRGEEIRY